MSGTQPRSWSTEGMVGVEPDSGRRGHDSLAAALSPQGQSYSEIFNMRRSGGKVTAGSSPRHRPSPNAIQPQTPEHGKDVRGGEPSWMRSSADNVPTTLNLPKACDAPESRTCRPASLSLLHTDDEESPPASEWLYSPTRGKTPQTASLSRLAAGESTGADVPGATNSLELEQGVVRDRSPNSQVEGEEDVTHWLTEECERSEAGEGLPDLAESEEWLLQHELQLENHRLTQLEVQQLRGSAFEATPSSMTTGNSTQWSGRGGPSDRHAGREYPQDDARGGGHHHNRQPSSQRLAWVSGAHESTRSFASDATSTYSASTESTATPAAAAHGAQRSGYISLREKVDRGAAVQCTSPAPPAPVSTDKAARIRPQRLPELPQEAKGPVASNQPTQVSASSSGGALRDATRQRRGGSKKEAALRKELAEAKLELRLTKEKLLNEDLRVLMEMKNDKDRADVLQAQNIHLRRLISTVPIYSSELSQIVEAVNAQMEGRNSVEVLMKPLPRGTHRLPEWVEDRQAPPSDGAADAYTAAVADAMDAMKGSLLTLRCTVEQVAAEAYGAQLTEEHCQIQ